MWAFPALRGALLQRVTRAWAYNTSRHVRLLAFRCEFVLPQVVVTFELSEELVLLVTAHDRIDDGFKQLVIKDRLPTPPRERPS